MAACNFTYVLNIPPAELLKEINRLVEEHQGEFQGDEQAGTFRLDIILGRVIGNYRISGDKVDITILEKPWLVGSETIGQTIKQYLPGLT